MRYQLIVYHEDTGHDGRQEFHTLDEARAAARIYRREYDGVGVYDYKLGIVRETLGRFPPISPSV